jgi:hypothetical protein
MPCTVCYYKITWLTVIIIDVVPITEKLNLNARMEYMHQNKNMWKSNCKQ